MNKFNYKYLTPFKWFVIENFPFIEADFDAITEWQLFEKLGNEINKIINSQNQVGTEMEILSNAFIELKEYINNYFDNLDVQEEINNKLNEMAESGQLTDIIAQYLQLQGLLCYNTKNVMKNAENLANGSFAKTFGDIEYNDGNGAFYKIREIKNTDVIDNINIIALVNYDNLIAERITNGTTLQIVSELPQEQINDTQYEEIKTENVLEVETMPVSYFENLENARQLTNENTENDLLKVATFNIHNERVPYDAQLGGIKKLTKLQNIFNKIGASLLGINETFDGLIYPANEFVTTEFLPNYNMVKTWENILPMMDYGEGILSHLVPQTTQTKIYVSYHAPEHQGYVKNVYNFNNKTISFYCTHLCFNDNDTIRNQLAELFTDVQLDTSTYKIILGDFNFDLSQYADYLVSFINAGYKLVNGGQYKTYDDERNIGIDEIMVSGNINIVSSGVGNSEYIEGLSDHFPVWATLSFE